jgi:hypothetical protein
MALTSSTAASPIQTQTLFNDLHRLFPSGTMAPFYPEIPLDDVEATAAFAVYAPAVGGLRASEIHAAAELNRWRTLLIHEGRVIAWASLRPDGNGLRIVEVNVSPWIDRVVSALLVAESDERVTAHDHELRFLESPRHSFFALWLVPTAPGKAGSDLMIPISEHGELEVGTIHDPKRVASSLGTTTTDTCFTTS